MIRATGSGAGALQAPVEHSNFLGNCQIFWAAGSNQQFFAFTERKNVVDSIQQEEMSKIRFLKLILGYWME